MIEGIIILLVGVLLRRALVAAFVRVRVRRTGLSRGLGPGACGVVPLFVLLETTMETTGVELGASEGWKGVMSETSAGKARARTCRNGRGAL